MQIHKPGYFYVCLCVAFLEFVTAIRHAVREECVWTLYFLAGAVIWIYLMLVCVKGWEVKVNGQ